jgi:hypothetical protein
MGYLTYGGSQEYEFDDRTLAHLKVAITMKLRRQESFLFSWSNPADRGGGRTSIWLNPSIPLTFRFSGSRPPQLNKEWLAALSELANTAQGLTLVSEQSVVGTQAGEARPTE